MMKKTVSPSRTYVAMVTDFEDSPHRLRKFTIPEYFGDDKNDSDFAGWFYLNRLDLFGYLVGVITYEDYAGIQEVESESWTGDSTNE